MNLCKSLIVTKSIFLKSKPQQLATFLEKKYTEYIHESKDLWKALRSLWLSSKASSCEDNTLKINNKVEHDFNSVLEGFRNYYSTLVENLVKMLAKPTNKYSINSAVKYNEHMNLSDYFHLTSVLEN